VPLEYKYESTASAEMEWVEPVANRASKKGTPTETVSVPTPEPKHSFDVPQIAADTGDESGFLGEDMDAVAPVRLDDLSDVGSLHKMEIENIITNKYKFHYKLENGRLYLFGKFDVSPYQILELNNKSGKKLFNTTAITSG
jgi:hypothetical protein